MSRRLPLIAPAGSAAPPGSHARPLQLDPRAIALVCEPGLDACAAWLGALHGALSRDGAPAPIALCSAATPLTAAARALCAQLTAVIPGDARSVFVDAPLWLLVTDVGFEPVSARLVVRLCDPVGAPRRRTDADPVLLPYDRVQIARALGAALADRLAARPGNPHSGPPSA